MPLGLLRMPARENPEPALLLKRPWSTFCSSILIIQFCVPVATGAHLVHVFLNLPGVTMIAVIYEVEPAENEADHYLQLAADLKPLLQQVDGFISIERFESLASPGKLRSLSFWRDEEAVKNWRNMEQHGLRSAQGEVMFLPITACGLQRS